MAAIFAEKRAHAPDESYHSSPDPDQGLPATAQETIAADWEMAVPELVTEHPSLATVRERLNAYLVETLAPALEEAGE